MAKRKRKKKICLIFALFRPPHANLIRELLSLQPKLVEESEKEKQMAIVEDTNSIVAHKGLGSGSRANK